MPSTAVVTGAGSGIGFAIAERYLNEGWSVIAVGRRREPLEKLASLKPDRVRIETCDLSQASDVSALVERLRDVAALAALVNNAGVYERRSLADSDDALWSRMFDFNLMSAVRLTRGLMPLLIAGGGCVVNVSSTLGLKPVADTGPYSALKAAMVNWTETLAIECGPKGVRANCVCPGLVDTPIHNFDAATRDSLGPMQPLGRIGRPEDVAHSVWSVSGPGSEWMTGAVLSIDGGIHLA